MLSLIIYLFFCLGTTPGSAQRLRLAMHPKIFLTVLGTIRDGKDQTQVACLQGKCPTHYVIAPACCRGFIT